MCKMPECQKLMDNAHHSFSEPNMTFLNRFCPTDSPMHKEHFAIFLCQWLKQLLNFKIIEAEFYAN